MDLHSRIFHSWFKMTSSLCEQLHPCIARLKRKLEAKQMQKSYCMNDDLMEALAAAKEVAQTDHVIEFHGKRLQSIKIAFRRLCKECCIKASPHVLRHTAATWLVMDGVPLSEVARLLGNSEAMVEKVYGKHSPDYLRRAVGVLKFNKPSILQV